MKIDDVEGFLIADTYVVRVRADDGTTGLGQTACWGYPEAVERVVARFRDYLIGKDPSHIEHHWQFMYRMGPFRGSVLTGAVSAVDIALWDLKGKRFQAPVWDLLGGKCRDRVRLHLLMGGRDPGDARKRAQAARDEGFTAVKLDPLPEAYHSMTLSRLIKSTREVVAAVREGAGDDVDIILELHRKLTPMVSIALVDALVEFHPMFVEDPIQIDSIISQGELAKRFTPPLANGERMHTIWEFRELLCNGGAQYVRPDIGLAGGITHCKKIAAVAESFHSAVVTHNYLGPILTAASVQLDVSIPNFIVQEYSKADESPKNRIYRTVLKRKGGFISAPEAPGIGVELDEALLKRAKYEPRDLTKIVPLRDDGSVAYSV
jgi:galactonate dehydratase